MVACGSVTAARPGVSPDATLIARCVHGFEWICADEVSARFPDAGDMTLSRREITFRLPEASHDLFELRTVDDVFVEVGQVSGVGTSKDVPQELARRLIALPWPVQL